MAFKTFIGAAATEIEPLIAAGGNIHPFPGIQLPQIPRGVLARRLFSLPEAKVLCVEIAKLMGVDPQKDLVSWTFEIKEDGDHRHTEPLILTEPERALYWFLRKSGVLADPENTLRADPHPLTERFLRALSTPAKQTVSAFVVGMRLTSELEFEKISFSRLTHDRFCDLVSGVSVAEPDDVYMDLPVIRTSSDLSALPTESQIKEISRQCLDRTNEAAYRLPSDRRFRPPDAGCDSQQRVLRRAGMAAATANPGSRKRDRGP